MVVCECGLRVQTHQLLQHRDGRRHRNILRQHGSGEGTSDRAAALAQGRNHRAATAGIHGSLGAMVRVHQMEEHVNGKKHQKFVRSVPAEHASAVGSATTNDNRANVQAAGVRCDACNIMLDTMQEYIAHARDFQHQRLFAELASANHSSGAASKLLRCTLCDRDVPPARWHTHVTRDTYHRRRQRFAEISAQLAEAESDKCGIIVSRRDGVDFGIIEVNTVSGLSAECTAEVSVSNTVSGNLITLARVGFSSSLKKDAQSANFSAVLRGASRFIDPSRPRTVLVTFHPSYAGRFEDTLELEFHDINNRQRFSIIRRTVAIVGSVSDHDILRPTGPYIRPSFIPYQPDPKAIPTSRPPTWTKIRWVIRLPDYAVPGDLQQLFNNPNRRHLQTEVRAVYMPHALDVRSYAKYFQTLLYLEELQLSLDLSRFNLSDTPLVNEYPRYRLKVPGLPEGKPSITVGDKIFVKRSADVDVEGTWYEGVVHRTFFKEVTLYMSDKFSLYKQPGRKVDVRFKLNRLTLRREHHAVALHNAPLRIIFPEQVHVENLRRVDRTRIDRIQLVDRTLANNSEQLETVAAIIDLPPGSVPFVVFGPPGTGKTVTIVEAMHQLLQRDPKARILACAPQNRSADLLVEKLVALGPAQVFRLNALSRNHNTSSGPAKDFSLVNANSVYVIPELKLLQSFRVIVCTCASAGALYGLGMKPGWFTHIFIDEAGQLSEPGTMIPIKTMVDDRTNVVLAGDNKQLSATVRSNLARDLGLKVSFFERLMNMPVYNLEAYKGRTIMKLLDHWRSHPAIIEIANNLFYQGELRPCSDPVITNSMLRSDVLVSPTFPIVFHAVGGKDQQEEGSPSFFNIEEASLVRKYCEQLVADRKIPLNDKDIGVISPYNAQCGKIRLLLGRSDHNLEGIKVGSVEEFQGQERRVIIISTVRSRRANVIRDIRLDLGFVGDSRRLNVAITRARALLIVIGDPTILMLDPTWRHFLEYIRSGGGWRGRNVNLDAFTSNEDYATLVQDQADQDTQEMIERIRAMIIDNHVADSWEVPHIHDDDDDDDGEAYMDRNEMEDE